MKRLTVWVLAVLLALSLGSCGALEDAAESFLAASRDTNARERAAALIDHFEDRYFLSALDDHRLGAVCNLYEAAMNYESTCRLNGLTAEELTQVWDLMLAECPELFQLDVSGGMTGMTNKVTGRFVSVDLKYQMSYAEYAESRSACEAVLAGFVRDAAGLAPEEREKLVFDAIASACRYDVDAPYAGTARGALLEHRAKCDGISAAMKWAMEELDIPCVTLTADIVGGVVGHAWNAVELDGAWYRVDLTQSVRIDEFVEAGLEDVIYYAFNISDSFVTERYEVLDCFASARELPRCVSMERSWFASRDLFIETEEDLRRVLERELSAFAGAGGGSVTLQFASAEDFAAFPERLGELIGAFYAGRDLRFASWSCHSLPYNVCVVRIEE